tara:strand:- start:2345 stop:2578 length:234 start_codon:yes stop_codon:yes gene_type:complete
MLAWKRKNFSTYVGWTNNLKLRVKKHTLGKGAKSTRGKKWKLIYYEIYNTKREAMRREYILKRDSATRKKLKEKFIK